MRRLSGKQLFPAVLILLSSLASSLAAGAQPQDRGSSDRVVTISENQLVVDGKKQPQLFGAEVQYFRLRGGYGPNMPRERVLALWNRALDLLVEAKMNAVSFYIPWDFHEYAEGKFDFTGTADLDHDGRPDYPSRDLVTFLDLVVRHGISRVLVRPGPYINAEWGFLGFGAIPSWFHDKYPDSHMRTPYGLRSKLYDYHDPDFQRYAALWFKALQEQVLDEQMGPGKPIIFLQLDNETNYQWQSIYSHDFGHRAIARYQKFLQDRFQSIEALNQAHGRQWERWSQIQPPFQPGRSIVEDQAWYQFADLSIYDFLRSIRRMWLPLGIEEPRVLFTLAESYNAPVNGLLPNYIFRNAKDSTGLMTVNLYPKTAEEPDHPLLNFPFKADLDIKAADEANDAYFGSRQEWVMGPEVQGGWWKGIEVSPEARQQTYLTALGHGLKALFVYYFNEGQNWDVEWGYDKIKPLYDQLRWERRLESVEIADLPDSFWNELQSRSDRSILVGFDARKIMKEGPLGNAELFFDAPLDGNAEPRNHYFDLKKIGERVVAPYQDFLARSLEVNDDVSIVKDSTSHQPSPVQDIPSLQASADWTGGLLGYLMNAGVNPAILHGDLSPEKDFGSSRLLAHLDTGINAQSTLERLKESIARGQSVVNFLANDVAKSLDISVPQVSLLPRNPDRTNAPTPPLEFHLNRKGLLSPAGKPETTKYRISATGPVYEYDLRSRAEGCEGILYAGAKVVGYRCKMGKATFTQIGALIFEDYNSSRYSHMDTPRERSIFMKALLKEASVDPLLTLSETASRTVAFARKDPGKKLLWITVKTGENAPQAAYLKLNPKLLKDALEEEDAYGVEDLLAGNTQKVTKHDLIARGFQLKLGPSGSAVYVVKPISR